MEKHTFVGVGGFLWGCGEAFDGGLWTLSDVDGQGVRTKSQKPGFRRY